MSGPRDRYDTRRGPPSVDDERDELLSKPRPPHERMRIQLQDEMSADWIYQSAYAYMEVEDRGPMTLAIMSELASAYERGDLSGVKIRLDRYRWQFVARALMTFRHKERMAREKEAKRRDAAARAATTRRIVPAAPRDSVAPVTPARAGSLVKRSALYGG